ncbi:hypothetical protein RFI_39333, partial [Reticulomyxa filosa]
KKIKKDCNGKKKDNNGKKKNKNRKKGKGKKRGEMEKEKWENIPQKHLIEVASLDGISCIMFDWPRLCWQINKIVIGNIQINDIYSFDNAKMFFITKATRADGFIFGKNTL